MGKESLGIPTVADRIAQQVVKARLEPEVDPLFHPDSYGYRPGKSALDAVGQARQRCWRYDWVLDLDIKGFFDNSRQDLLIRAVKKHATEQWIVLYIERWLKAPVQEEDGQLVPREKGTPQGGVISPLLANLFLHYAFDRWLAAHYPQVPFERYADDVIVHCRTEREAQEMRKAIAHDCRTVDWNSIRRRRRSSIARMICGREDIPEREVRFSWLHVSAEEIEESQGKVLHQFQSGSFNKAAKAIRADIRSWNLHQRSDKSIEDLSRMFNPIIRGWLQYYGRYYRSALYPTMRQLDRDLVLWARAEIQEAAPSSPAGDSTGSRASRVALRSCSRTGRWGCGVAP